jgi:Fur family zinc uptake transcriptional regulator
LADAEGPAQAGKLAIVAPFGIVGSEHGDLRGHRVMMPAIFPAPDHDHARCAADAIVYAEAVCAERAQRLTAPRRQVLEVLASSHKPIGAYEIIDSIARKHKARPAPITVYRALEFLMKHGLVHRIESRNAYLACIHNHDKEALVAFLMCNTCGLVGEASTDALAQQLAAAAKKAGFQYAMSVIEITGTCSNCRSDRRAPQRRRNRPSA